VARASAGTLGGTRHETLARPRLPDPAHRERVLSDADIDAFKAQSMALCDRFGSSRELSLARTKLDEAVFWMREHLRKVEAAGSSD
jgi:hypothetical protein